MKSFIFYDFYIFGLAINTKILIYFKFWIQDFVLIILIVLIVLMVLMVLMVLVVLMVLELLMVLMVLELLELRVVQATSWQAPDRKPSVSVSWSSWQSWQELSGTCQYCQEASTISWWILVGPTLKRHIGVKNAKVNFDWKSTKVVWTLLY